MVRSLAEAHPVRHYMPSPGTPFVKEAAPKVDIRAESCPSVLPLHRRTAAGVTFPFRADRVGCLKAGVRGGPAQRMRARACTDCRSPS